MRRPQVPLAEAERAGADGGAANGDTHTRPKNKKSCVASICRRRRPRRDHTYGAKPTTDF